MVKHRNRARKSSHRIFKPVILLLAALLAFPLAVPVSTPAAVAAGNGTTHAGGQYGQGIGYWVGSYKIGTGEIVFCAADNQAGPPDGRAWGGSFKPEYKAATVRTSWTGIHGQDVWNGVEQGPGAGATGKTLTGRNLQRMSYVLSKWGGTGNNNRARAIKRL